MGVTQGQAAPSWAWGTGRQLLACRLSHALGLLVLLAMLLARGWTP